MNGRVLIPALLTLAAPASADVSPATLLEAFGTVCVTAEPPGLLQVGAPFQELSDREIFAGPTDRYWIAEGEAVRFGVTFTTTARSCEFAVDAPVLDAAGQQSFAANAILSIQSMAGRQGAVADVTFPEEVATIRWAGTPQSYTGTFDHLFEVSSSANQTLIRSVIEIRSQ